MRKRWFAVLLVCAFALISSAPAFAAPPDANDTGSVIVKYEPTAAAQALQAAGGLPSLAEKGYRTLQVPEGISRADFIAALQRSPGVVSVEPDARVYAAATPDDVYYAGTQSPYMNLIGAPAAWDLTTGNHRITVAVLDSGTDLSHPDLSGQLWENPNDAVSNGIDNDGNGCINDRYGCRFINLTAERRTACGYTSSIPTGAVLDDHGTPGSVNHSHGTLVAGILGATGDNGIGTAGVAWDIRIMTVKVLDCGLPSHAGEPGGDISNVAQGIDYARRMGANVISLSLASQSGDTTADTSILRDALQAAKDAGVIVVAAAGNHAVGSTQVSPGYPAAYTQYPNLVAVGAADNLNGDVWASYSNYGPTISFAAPGNNLAGPIRTDIGFANPYGIAGPGTSFATPLVSGMFALMMSRNSRLSALEYIQIAKATATPAPPGPPNWAGAGIINIGAAVNRIPMSLSGSALKDWKDTPAGTVVTALIDGNDCGTATTSLFSGVSSYTIRVPSAAELPGCGAPGKLVQMTVAGQPAFPTLAWGARNANLAITNWDISSASPPPGPTVTQTLGGGWSQLPHLAAAGPVPLALGYLPTSWSTALDWSPTTPGLGGPGAYLRFIKNVPAYVNSWATVQTYDAFWVNSPAALVTQANPNPAPGRVVELSPGWNNIVYTGTNRAVGDALIDVNGDYAEVLQYDNATQRWLSYLPGQPRFLNDFGGMFELQVYWIYMTQPGSLTMR